MPAVQSSKIYRSTYRRVVFVVYVVVAVYLAVDAVRTAGAGRATAVVLGLAAIGVALYALTWRPSVEAGADVLVLRNVWRDVEIPWQAVQEVDNRLGLRVHTHAKRYDAWAAPAARNSDVLARRRRQAVATIPTMNPMASALQAREATAAENAASAAGDPGDAPGRGTTTAANPAAALVQHAWEGWRVATGRPDPAVAAARASDPGASEPTVQEVAAQDGAAGDAGARDAAVQGVAAQEVAAQEVAAQEVGAGVVALRWQYPLIAAQVITLVGAVVAVSLS